MKKLLLLLLIVFSVDTDAEAQLTVRVVRDSLFIPWELVYGPDNHIWFTQKNGYICRMQPASGKIDTLYYETNTRIQSEGGMLGMVLHPQFSNTPHVFVAYNYLDASVYKLRVARYEYNSTTNTLQNPQTIIENIGAASFHNGCRLLIIDGYLYITTGDATVTSTSQNLGSLNGKLLRLNLDGSIPADNPIAGNAAWSWGHRNAQGMVYANGKIYQTEHGANTDDEVNVIQKGRNYGWPTVQGYCNTATEISFCNDSAVVEPIEAWTPTLAVCGMDYYDHPMFPQFQKSLLMTTLKDSTLYQLKLNTASDDISSISKVALIKYRRLRDICISPEGRIYISTSNSASSGTGTRIDRIVEIYDPSYNSIVQTENQQPSIEAYPNPATDMLTIKIKQYVFKGSADYKIVNMNGQVVMQGKLQNTSTAIGVKTLPAGLYKLMVYDGAALQAVTGVAIQ
jgi:aldose sugar dehydrogenase